MDPENRMRVAAGETEHLPPAPDQSGLGRLEAVEKDEAYSPSSEEETERKQAESPSDSHADDIDLDAVKVVPGTGGPDDVGDVEVDPDDLNLPGSSGATPSGRDES